MKAIASGEEAISGIHSVADWHSSETAWNKRNWIYLIKNISLFLLLFYNPDFYDSFVMLGLNSSKASLWRLAQKNCEEKT